MKKREINEAPRPKVPKPKQFRARTRGESVSEQKTVVDFLADLGYENINRDLYRDMITTFKKWLQQKQQQYESRNYNELLEDLKNDCS